MLEMLKSITAKITIINNKKYNSWLFYFALLPCISFFFMSDKIMAFLFSFLNFFLIFLIAASSNFPTFVDTYLNKKDLFKLLNNKEKELLNKSKIDFSLSDIKKTLFEIQKICIDNVCSEKELKDILIFIINNNEIDIDIDKKTYTVQIIEYIKESKYCNTALIDLIYKEENNFKISDKIILDFSNRRERGCKLFNLIYEKSSLNHIIKYNNYSEELLSTQIVEKILKEIEIKSLIKIIFEKDKRKLNNNELEILDFFNTLDLEKLVNIKKNILDKTLNLKDKKNIEFYETEFLELCKRLDVDKKLLYIMEESLSTKEEEVFLKVISI